MEPVDDLETPIITDSFWTSHDVSGIKSPPRQGYTQFGGLRPFGVSFLVAGCWADWFAAGNGKKSAPHVTEISQTSRIIQVHDKMPTYANTMHVGFAPYRTASPQWPEAMMCTMAFSSITRTPLATSADGRRMVLTHHHQQNVESSRPRFWTKIGIVTCSETYH